MSKRYSLEFFPVAEGKPAAIWYRGEQGDLMPGHGAIMICIMEYGRATMKEAETMTAALNALDNR